MSVTISRRLINGYNGTWSPRTAYMRKGISTNAAGRDPELKTPGFCAALSDLSKSEFLCHIHAPRVRGFHAWSPQGVKVDRGMRPCPCADGLESSIKAS
jgi:hypothetical protein